MKHNIFILLILVSIGCKNEKMDATTRQQPVNNATSAVTLPPFPIAELKNLFENGSGIDYIFNDLPFSVSQSTSDGVKGNVSMISQHSPTNFNSSCPSLGREFFSVAGEIVWEAEIHFDKESNCGAYVFYKDKKAVFISDISDQGKLFYKNLINQSFQHKQ